MSISAISVGDVHRITSGQVIIDLTSAVKELVENAIDAHATRVDIVFKNHGISAIEVSDNGDGIPTSDHASICLKHTTSKLTTYEDLAHVATFGFRGEAMSSLCAIADVQVTTNTDPRIPRAAKLEFDRLGNLSASSVVSATKGTSVYVSNLFENLPVRRKDFMKNAKREHQKAMAILQAYAIINTGVRFTCHHVTERGKKTLLFSTAGNTLKGNLINVYGSNGMLGLIPLDLTLDIAKFKVKGAVGRPEITFVGFISNCSFGQGRSAGDRQLWYINKRPVNLPQFLKVMTEVYRSFNNVQFPVLILNMEIDPEALDINVTPDKRTVFVSNESVVLEELRERVYEMYLMLGNVIPRIQTTGLQMSGGKGPAFGDIVSTMRTREKFSVIDRSQSDTELSDHERLDSLTDLDKFRSLLLTPTPTSQTTSLETPTMVMNVGEQQFVTMVAKTRGGIQFTPEIELDADSAPKEDPLFAAEEESDDQGSCCSYGHGEKKAEGVPLSNETQKNVLLPLQELTMPDGGPPDVKLEDADFKIPSLISIAPTKRLGVLTFRSSKLIHNLKTGIKVNPAECVPIINAKSLMERAAPLDDKEVRDVAIDAVEAEKMLTLMVAKDDFLHMNIIGQFNLGFIIVTRKKQDSDATDLFVIDQHASDEKYNFETLQKTTVFQSQPLVIPRDLEMNAIDELVVMDNVAVFEKNGFRLKVWEDRHPGSRIQLLSLPMSKNTVFDLNDFDELLYLLKEASDSSDRVKRSLRCSKIRAMFAMRACRSSIMVGRHLKRGTMVQVVRNLGELDKPWNCPHGRPTMRHLMEMSNRTLFMEDYAS
ncbi:hypothetical protein BABINDRAFT_14083 [Babjeviella inositovora NRRL Y-12698]|uniref:DNA mismatch repair protein S5 domain-containing protein n=1 Tax=Babjeviella inositovora NRRL Y-12698 TaxID=984486 RepID=A0A1E3QN31_9ASCO|nr:uncharacterized protein BABINDRAFT_14083 [Babjeviella inositovora NRRL Y-12698]ODQ79081.1 hypothetical protein BABINDRAFT_14083 [Babjeviella inositovora NRRL Y-12698]